ncbi:DUF1345 domain-containing protein [Mycobacterium sp. MMS18-G62]
MSTPATHDRRGHVVARILIAGLAGAVAGVIVGETTRWRYGPAVGWILAAAIYVAWTWLKIIRMDPPETQEHATEAGGDSTRQVTEIFVLLASVASLGGVALLLTASNTKGLDADMAALVGVLSVATSWAVVHTVYALRYAKQYFQDPVGGVDFGYTPTYRDFAYLAFTVGMTYQVSDTDLKNSPMRRVALQHAMLSYVFGTVILAITINLVVNLGNSGT